MEKDNFGIVQLDSVGGVDVFGIDNNITSTTPLDILSDDDIVDVFADDDDTPTPTDQKTKTEDDKPVITAEEEVLDVFSMDEDEPEKIKEDELDDEVASDEPESTIYESFAQDLISAGVYGPLGEGEELPKDAESLKEFVYNQKIKGVNEYLEKFLSQKGEEYYEAFRAIFVNGVHPEEYFSTLIKDSDILGLDLEKEENQEKVVRKFYSEVKGLSGSKLERVVGGLKEDGELGDEAVTAMEYFEDSKKKELRDKEETKIQEAQRKLQVRQHFNHLVNTSLQEKLSSREVDGVVLNESTADSVSRFLTAPAYKLASGEIITEYDKFLMDMAKSENIDTAIKIAILRENGFDFKKIKIKDKAKDAAKDSLFASLAKSKARESAVSKSKPTIDNFTTHLKKNY